MEIVRAKRDEEERLKEAMDLVWQVFNEFEAPEYSDEGIAQFQDYIISESVQKLMENEVFQLWYTLAEGRIIGVLAATLQPCHIHLLFVDKDWHHQGIARALTDEMIRYAKAQYQDVTSITVHASPYGLEAYRRLGFDDLDTEQLQDGLRFTPMVRFL